MSFVKFTTKMFLAIAILFSSSLVNAQELNDAIKKLHEGLAVINDDPETALNILNECVSLCDEIGPDADETKAEAEMRIPTCYYKIAKQLSEDKKIEEALEGFVKTIEIAEKYNDNETKEQALQTIPKLYYAIAGAKYKSGDLNGAIEYYKKTVESDPLQANAFYNMSIVYAKMKDNDNSLIAAQNAIDAAEKSNDSKTSEKAKQRAYSILLKDGVDAKAKSEYDNAIALLLKAAKYSETADVYYFMAQCYNKIEKWDEAIEAGKKSLQYENGDDEKKARVHYEVASSYLSKGDNEAACSSYKNALYGAYLESAKYQIEVVLKCQ